jgi:hypothetical protein
LYNLYGIQLSIRVGRAVSKVAVAVREGIGSIVRHSGKAAELVGPYVCRVSVAVKEGIGSFVGIQGKQQS